MPAEDDETVEMIARLQDMQEHTIISRIFYSLANSTDRISIDVVLLLLCSVLLFMRSERPLSLCVDMCMLLLLVVSAASVGVMSDENPQFLGAPN